MQSLLVTSTNYSRLSCSLRLMSMAGRPTAEASPGKGVQGMLCLGIFRV